MFFFIMPTQLPFYFDAQGYNSAMMTGATLSVLMFTGGASRCSVVAWQAGILTASVHQAILLAIAQHAHSCRLWI
jgi:hypothetical protein